MNWIRVLLPAAVVVGIAWLVQASSQTGLRTKPLRVEHSPQFASDLIPPQQAMFETLGRQQNDRHVRPADVAGRLAVLRRLHLALVGTGPSLEEIRRFEADPDTKWLDWTDQLLKDRRCSDYLAARLSRIMLGTDEGQFIVLRRDRFSQWLSDKIQQDVPFDRVVRDAIASEGLWTGQPAVNFVTAAVVDGKVDENQLAGRTVRAFLGQRMDCAQCHDHPFEAWKQGHFEGLAAFYGPTKISAVGVEDDPKETFSVEDRMTLKSRVVAPSVPFHPEWLPAEGSTRERLAGWVTHPDNRRLDRAIVNRVWALLYGRPLHSPIDDIPDPPELGNGADPEPIDILAEDFRTHGRSLHRLIKLIVISAPFNYDSRHDGLGDEKLAGAVEETWAAYPLTRLRPEQLIGSMLQAWSLQTVDQNSHVAVRLFKIGREIDFIREYGDLGDDEFTERSGTIPQALLRMNGEFARQLSEANPVSAAGRIQQFAKDPERAVEVAFLACLTRRPTPEERAHFVKRLADPDESRKSVLEDLYWTLFNSPEFSWNH